MRSATRLGRTALRGTCETSSSEARSRGARFRHVDRLLLLFLVTLMMGCSEESRPRILAARPPPRAPTPSASVASLAPAPAPSPSPSPIEEHDDSELARHVVSANEILAVVYNGDEVFVARTTDGGSHWTRTKL